MESVSRSFHFNSIKYINFKLSRFFRNVVCKQYGSDRSISLRGGSYIFITPCIKLQQLCNLQNYHLTKSTAHIFWHEFNIHHVSYLLIYSKSRILNLCLIKWLLLGIILESALLSYFFFLFNQIWKIGF